MTMGLSSHRGFVAGIAVAVVVVIAAVLASVSMAREQAPVTSSIYGAVSTARATASAERAPSVRETPDAATPERSTASRFTSPVHRMRVDRLGVDAPLVTLGVDRQGVMEAPADPGSVGWYEFTSRPGLGSGNAVFAGHRDSRRSGPALQPVEVPEHRGP
jgi:sortase (surface protein transpeptidase)